MYWDAPEQRAGYNDLEEPFMTRSHPFQINDPRDKWRPVFPQASPPIFRQDQAGRSLFYAPGWVVRVAKDHAVDFSAGLHGFEHGNEQAARALLQKAEAAETQWVALHQRPYEPVCLTLYLNNTCNLACSYCQTEPDARRSNPLQIKAILSAGEIVAENCRIQKKPFTVVFHGGGEPSLDHPLIFLALDGLEAIAAQKRLSMFRYMATNGVMTPEVANRLASRLDLLGISCDGPADIQNSQRSLRKKGMNESEWYVEQTARAVHAAGKSLHVRVTVTPESLSRQAEIAEYICQRLHPKEIAVEPVYAVGRAKGRFTFRPEQAEEFVEAFSEAEATARQYGVRWSSSGSRPDEIHDVYCHVLRDVLNLVPEGMATACFKMSRGKEVIGRGLDLGNRDEADGRFRLDAGQVEKVRKMLSHQPAECVGCFNYFSCTRECPEICLLDPPKKEAGFRCRLNMLLADRAIQQAADRLGHSVAAGGPVMD
jgi:uncharacterized protein